MYASFIEALPHKVRSAEFKDEGTRFRKREKAISYRYLELNQLYKKFIALDIDEPASAYLWDERGMPPPSIVVINPENTHCHYLYELNTPVYYTQEARRAPQKFYEATDIALTRKLGADPAFTGHLVKNPLHPSWRTIRHQVSYDLEDFQEFGVDLTGCRRKQVLRDSGIGRNTTLFDTLRHWAYQYVLEQPSYAVFQVAVDTKALSINGAFLDCEKGILPAKEVLSTARSVGTWTWRHKDSIGNQKNRGVMGLPADMSTKAKQSAGAAYAHSNNAAKQSTRDAVLQAAIALRAAGTPITQQSVAIRADVSMRTVKGYWNEVDAQLGLYKKRA